MLKNPPIFEVDFFVIRLLEIMQFLFVSLFILSTYSAFATGQVPDFLISQNDTLPIFTNPLEQYFEKTGNRELPDFVGCGSTACWRGYSAIWELRNDSLLLVSIKSCHDDCGLTVKEVNLEKMFGSQHVFASWFSGQIRMPLGKLVQYIHMGYASIYESEKLLRFSGGYLKKSIIKPNKKVVDKIYRFRKNETFAKRSVDTIFYFVKTKIDWEKLDASKRMYDDDYTLIFSKKGKIEKVNFTSIGTTKKEKRNEFWYSITERKCRRTIKVALKGLDLSYLCLDSKLRVRILIFYNSTEKRLELWN